MPLRKIYQRVLLIVGANTLVSAQKLETAEVAESAHILESKKELAKMDNQFLDIKNVPKVPKLPPSDKTAQTTHKR